MVNNWIILRGEARVATGGCGSIPGSPSPSIFRVKFTREKIRKGEGEPGDKASHMGYLYCEFDQNLCCGCCRMLSDH